MKNGLLIASLKIVDLLFLSLVYSQYIRDSGLVRALYV